jgi:hypothetical protein
MVWFSIEPVIISEHPHVLLKENGEEIFILE